MATYRQKWGLKGKVVAVVRVTDEGVAQSWAWGRWVDIPSDALPDRDETMVDVITEAEATAMVGSDLFDDERGPDPEA